MIGVSGIGRMKHELINDLGNMARSDIEALMEAATGHRDIVDAARACGARMAPMDDVAAPEAPQAPQARRRAPRVRPADQG